MKLGISLKIDVKKLDKARFFAAQSGATYVDLTTFVDTENVGQYGDHGFISQSTTKEERDQKVQLPIVGNAKIFFGLPQAQQAPQQSQGGYQQAQSNFAQQQQLQQTARQATNNAVQQNTQHQELQVDFDDDIPF